VKRIALYGGTFDPVHVGHLAVARGVARLFGLDEARLIPAHVAPHKRGIDITSAWHRHAMLALATQDAPEVRISTLELDAPAKPYTIETLTRLKAELHRRARLFFVMGLDSWLDIKTWREWEKVLTTTDHIVVARPGYEWADAHVTPEIRRRIVNLWGREPFLHDDGETRIYATDAVQQDVSATDVREGVRAGKPELWRPLVSPQVAAYIEKYGLYE
jgi:nicotinate-nucleotide adenylyltransferase